MRQKSFFICGTDTGVGKTLVTGSLLLWLNARGIKAGGFKPMESGCLQMKRHLKRADSELLKKCAKMDEDLDLINPYYFKDPVTPLIAAQREGKKILFSKIQGHFEQLKKRYQILLAEGAGGLLVPIAYKKTSLDLIKKLNLPVIVIGRLGLGTLNHTLLTLEHLKKNHVRVAGVILNEITPQSTLAEKTNPQVLKSFGVPLWGVFPHLRRKTFDQMKSATSRLGSYLLNQL